MDIVGIACRDFLTNLCPAYRLEPKGNETLTSKRQRLRRLQVSPLFRELKRGLSVSAFLVNPYCDYAKQRTLEEKDNPECRLHILRGIQAVRTLYEDLTSAMRNNPQTWEINGRVTISLLKTNPYVSYTWIELLEGESELLFIGFLLRKRLGINSPKLLIQREPRVIRAFDIHLGQLESDVLFDWERGRRPEFNDQYLEAGRYDVFLCHNHLDKLQVKEIGNQLQARGFLPWIDERDIRLGRMFNAAIEEALRKVRCVAVFFGPTGLGPWQQMEIAGALSRAVREGLPVIPVILKGVQGEPVIDGFLKEFPWIDFRRPKDSALEKLCRGIREANEA
jgi:hypothetical protein